MVRPPRPAPPRAHSWARAGARHVSTEMRRRLGRRSAVPAALLPAAAVLRWAGGFAKHFIFILTVILVAKKKHIFQSLGSEVHDFWLNLTLPPTMALSPRRCAPPLLCLAARACLHIPPAIVVANMVVFHETQMIFLLGITSPDRRARGQLT